MTSPDPAPDVLATFRSAAQAFADLVDRIPADSWSGPGLGEWDLRSLVGHTSRSLITVDTYLDRPTDVEAVPSPEAYLRAGRALVNADPTAVAQRGRDAGVALGEDPARAVRALVERVLPRVAEAGDPVIETIAGGMRLRTYLATRTFELVVHTLDICRATGLPTPSWPESVLLQVVTLASVAAVDQDRGVDLLLALTGRSALPPLSVV